MSVPLKLFQVHDAVLYKPDAAAHKVGRDDPALPYFTDFGQSPIVTVWIDVPIDRALELMIQAGVRLAFVIDRNQELRGLITSFDIQGEAPTKLMVQRNLKRSELTVGDLMEPLREWKLTSFADARRATIAQVVDAMKRVGRRHLIVVQHDHDNDHEPWRLRGLYAASKLERALGHPIEIAALPSTFADIEAAVEHPDG